MTEELERFRAINKLKSVYRFASVDQRHESAAEHSWSSLLLADFFLSDPGLNIDRLKVYELLMYHDLVEIETGDCPADPNNPERDKKDLEREGARILAGKLPKKLSRKYLDLFSEFEESSTVEARFARAIDRLDAEIHELDYKQDWKGWTERFLVDTKGPLFEEFPNLKRAFAEIVEFLRAGGYFEK